METKEELSSREIFNRIIKNSKSVKHIERKSFLNKKWIESFYFEQERQKAERFKEVILKYMERYKAKPLGSFVTEWDVKIIWEEIYGDEV